MTTQQLAAQPVVAGRSNAGEMETGAVRTGLLLLLFLLLNGPGWGQEKDTGWLPLGSPELWSPDVLSTMPERFLILGEVHGTAECPRLALGLARSLRVQGRKAVLAIEWPADLQDDIAGGKWEELKSHGLFKAGDGRTSQAMVEVIRQAQGEGIPVLCFDQIQPGAKEREESCARAVRQISKEHPEATVVVLTGNRHSRIQGPPEDVPSTAMLLRAQGAEVLSIRLTAQRGEAWVLSAKGRGPQPVGSPLADSSPPAYRRHSSAQEIGRASCRERV